MGLVLLVIASDPYAWEGLLGLLSLVFLLGTVGSGGDPIQRFVVELRANVQPMLQGMRDGLNQAANNLSQSAANLDQAVNRLMQRVGQSGGEALSRSLSATIRRTLASQLGSADVQKSIQGSLTRAFSQSLKGLREVSIDADALSDSFGRALSRAFNRSLKNLDLSGLRDAIQRQLERGNFNVNVNVSQRGADRMAPVYGPGDGRTRPWSSYAPSGYTRGGMDMGLGEFGPGTTMVASFGQAAPVVSRLTGLLGGLTGGATTATGAMAGLAAAAGSLVFGGFALYNIVNRLISALSEATVQAIEFSQAELRLAIAVRASQRVYGEQIGTLAEWRQRVTDLRREYGVFSQQDATQAIASTLQLTRSMGLTREQTEALTEATAQLAFANGTTLADALGHAISFMQGQYARGMEKYGLDTNRAAVASFANLHLGIEGTFGQLDEHTKRVAALGLILQFAGQQSEEMADLLREPTVQLARNRAAIADNSKDIGGLFVPAVLAATEAVANWTGRLADLADAIKVVLSLRAGLNELAGGGFSLPTDFLRSLATSGGPTGFFLRRSIEGMLDALPDSLRDRGRNVAQSFLDGIRDRLEDTEDSPFESLIRRVTDTDAFRNMARSLGLIPPILSDAEQNAEELTNAFGRTEEQIDAIRDAALDAAQALGEAMRDRDARLTTINQEAGPFGSERREAVIGLMEGQAEAGASRDAARVDAARQYGERVTEINEDYAERQADIDETYAERRHEITMEGGRRAVEIEEELGERLGDIDRQGARAREEIGENLSEQLADIERDGAKRREDIAENLAERLTDIEERAVEGRADAAEELGERLSDLEENFNRQRIDAQADYDRRIREMTEDFNLRRQEEDAEQQRDEARELEDHLRRLRDIRERYSIQIDEAVQRRDARAILNLQRQRALDIRDATEDFETRGARRREDAEQRRRDEDAEFQRRLARERERFELERQEQERRYAEQRAEAQAAYDERLADIEAALIEQRAEANEQAAEQLRDLNERLAEQRQAAREAAAERLADLEENLAEQRRAAAEAAEEQRADLAVAMERQRQEADRARRRQTAEAKEAWGERLRDAKESLDQELAKIDQTYTEEINATIKAFNTMESERRASYKRQLADLDAWFLSQMEVMARRFGEMGNITYQEFRSIAEIYANYFDLERGYIPKLMDTFSKAAAMRITITTEVDSLYQGPYWQYGPVPTPATPAPTPSAGGQQHGGIYRVSSPTHFLAGETRTPEIAAFIPERMLGAVGKSKAGVLDINLRLNVTGKTDYLSREFADAVAGELIDAFDKAGFGARRVD